LDFFQVDAQWVVAKERERVDERDSAGVVSKVASLAALKDAYKAA
jgi:hypothetical protein